jgi:hypothetical protein
VHTPSLPAPQPPGLCRKRQCGERSHGQCPARVIKVTTHAGRLRFAYGLTVIVICWLTVLSELRILTK